MAAVHSKHTKPEMSVRSLVHRLGYRYRLHVDNLPGKPDLVFPPGDTKSFLYMAASGIGTRDAATPLYRKRM
ncbi:MAG: hypothetical protein ACRD3K_11420 [Edaphobacter sp.]